MELFGILRMAASPKPGFRMVLLPTSWSYCSYTHLLLETFGDESRAKSDFLRSCAGSRPFFVWLGLGGLLADRGTTGASATSLAGRSATAFPFHLNLI